MNIVNYGNGWIILHANKIIDQTFDSEEQAWTWADDNIDDQVFDSPNTLSPPLRYLIDWDARV